MRKIFFCLLAFGMCLSALANETGHFFVDLRADHVSLSEVTNSFESYTSIAEGSTFVLFRDTTDAWGIRHQSYQQFYQGVKVQNHMILVHASNDQVRFIHGHVMPSVDAPSSVSPRFTRRQAALKAPGTVREETVEPMIILHHGKYYHAYQVPSRSSLEVLYVDALTGEIICAESALRGVDMTCSGMTRYSGLREMTVNYRDDKYYLEDMGRKMFTLSAHGISLNPYYQSEDYFLSLPDSILAVLSGQIPDAELILQYWNRYVYGVMVQDYIDNRAVSVYSLTPDLDVSVVDSVLPREYLDIHWGMMKTIDFYRETFGRNSFDGNGYPVYNIAFPSEHLNLFPKMPVNAAAQCRFEPFYMFYGEGDGIVTKPVVALDVMAHEFTHMVTARNGNGDLVYSGESGALNESFSDCMAMGVLQFTFDSCRWSIGDDVTIQWPNMRDMADPNNSRGAQGDSAAHAQPDTYHGLCWWDTSAPTADNDMGGVHVNSGVQNYWFYLLCEGGSGTNDHGQVYSVEPIGMDKALQIVYRNLIFYLTPLATFEDARLGSLCAATDLYGFQSPEYISVMNAWYAVGVGDSYSGINQIVNDQSSNHKFIKDGQLFILRDGKTYNALGVEIK